MSRTRCKGLPADYGALNECTVGNRVHVSTKVKVLLTLDPVNYPLGLKDILTTGDIPVVGEHALPHAHLNMGTATRYSRVNSKPVVENAILWLGNGLDNA